MANHTAAPPLDINNEAIRPAVLVVDDEAFTRSFFSTIFQEEGYHIVTASCVSECMEKLAVVGTPDLIILDVRLPDGNGLELMKRLRDQRILVPIIVITAFGSISDAVNAMKLGAFDFITKPFEEINKIKISLKRALEHGWLEKENRMLRTQLQSRGIFHNIIGQSKQMQMVYDMIQKAANTDATILIEGESGTGKDLVAKAIHSNSKKNDKPYIPINCAALPESLLESALFGYEKGAFTGALKNTPGFFEEANGGTLFLDEIGDAPHSVQVKILRAVEDGQIYRVGTTKPVPVKVRLIFATNKDLGAEVEKGRFRRDLYYRINIIRILLPPLEERGDDIPILANSFIEKYCEDAGVKKKILSAEAGTLLMGRKWPGNVRELKNLVQRITVLHTGDVISAEDVVQFSENRVSQDTDELYALNFSQAREKFERTYFQRLIKMSGDNLSVAAVHSGMHIATIYRKLNTLAIKIK